MVLRHCLWQRREQHHYWSGEPEVMVPYWDSLKENSKSTSSHPGPSNFISGNKAMDTHFSAYDVFFHGVSPMFFLAHVSVPSSHHIPLRHSKPCTCSGFLPFFSPKGMSGPSTTASVDGDGWLPDDFLDWRHVQCISLVCICSAVPYTAGIMPPCICSYRILQRYSSPFPLCTFCLTYKVASSSGADAVFP